MVASRAHGKSDHRVALECGSPPGRPKAGEGDAMNDECEHWLVQRTLDTARWACVDCDREFKPVADEPTLQDIARRAVARARQLRPEQH
jgi:hypothetical protein